MAVLPVQKIRILTAKTDAGVLSEILQTLGVTELIPETSEDLQASQPTNFEARTRYAEVESARNFLAKYHTDGFFRTVFEGARAYTTPEEIKRLTEGYSIESIIKTVESFQSRLTNLTQEKRAIESDLRTLHTFERLDISLADIGETQLTSTLAVRGAERVIEKALLDIEGAAGADTAITHISPTAILVTYLKSAHIVVEEKISTNGLEIVTLPKRNSTAAAEIARLTASLEANEAAQVTIDEEIAAVAKNELPTLQKLCDISRWESEKSDTAQSLPSTERVSVLTAWVPKMAMPAIESALTEKLPASAIEVVDHGEEEPPTEISNESVIQPFEAVTKLYGVPFYKDLDPTPLLAVFFFVFFGLCLSDAGYGLIIMALTGIVLYKYHLDTGTKQLMTLLFFGGVGTLFAGILFGGYFGVAPADIHPALVPLQKFDPINNPLPVFYMSLVIGFVQVCFGIFLNLVRQMKLGEKKDAILDNVPWLFLFMLIAVALLNQSGFLNETLSTFLSAQQAYLFYFAAALLILTQGRKQKNPVMKLLYGLLGLYGGVNYFADVLSYSRIMALGLATGALAFSINSIASFVGGESFGISTIFMVLVLIFGHTLNIAISLLGTFINSARLQFVEFFSKFSTGTGRAFVPFKKEAQHIIILPDPPSSS